MTPLPPCGLNQYKYSTATCLNIPSYKGHRGVVWSHFRYKVNLVETNEILKVHVKKYFINSSYSMRKSIKSRNLKTTLLYNTSLYDLNFSIPMTSLTDQHYQCRLIFILFYQPKSIREYLETITLNMWLMNKHPIIQVNS